MSSSRKANYAPKREQDSFEELSGKLTADLRNHVRFMVRPCPNSGDQTGSFNNNQTD